MIQDFQPVNHQTYFDGIFSDFYPNHETLEQVCAGFTGRDMDYTSSAEPVVVFFPSGNYNQVTELGRYGNLSIAMGILSAINHPDNLFQIPEYKIFSLETGREIQLH